MQKTLKSRLISVIAVAMSLFHLYTGLFGVFEVAVQTGVHLIFAMALILLVADTRLRFPSVQGGRPRGARLRLGDCHHGARPDDLAFRQY